MGIKEVLIISTAEDIPRFERLLGDGTNLGMQFSYESQAEPNGIAQAFLIGEPFIQDGPVTLILGDNLFYGHGYLDFLKGKLENFDGATVFGYQVKDPERYGVVEFDDDGKVITDHTYAGTTDLEALIPYLPEDGQKALKAIIENQ